MPNDEFQNPPVNTAPAQIPSTQPTLNPSSLSTTTTQASKPPLSFGKIKKIFFLLVLCLILVLGGIFSYLNLFNNRGWVGGVMLPVSLNHPALIKSGVIYQFKGKLKEIKTTEKSTEIILEDQKDMPKFYLFRLTEFFLSQKNEPRKKITLKDLKQGQNLRVITFYDFNEKSWTLQQIYVDN